jgi:CHAT domain-containing protein/Tfp pilus assembly protein PilF
MQMCKSRVLGAAVLFFVTVTMGGRTLPQAHNQNTPSILKPGIVVEQISKNSEAEKAGLHDGDILLAWTGPNGKGEINSPFDLAEIEVEHAPRGTITLEGARGDERRRWALGPGDWGIMVRPNFPENLLARYQESQELAKAGDQSHISDWWLAAMETDQPGPPWMRSWLLIHTAGLLAESRHWEDADKVFEKAIEQAAGLNPGITNQLLRAWAHTFEQRSDWENAEKYYQQAIAEAQKLSKEKNLTVAASLNSLGLVAFSRGHLAKTEEYYGQALAIEERLAPASMVTARSLNGLGDLAEKRSELEKAEEHYRRALALGQKLAPESADVANSLHGIGNVAVDRGDLTKAEEYFRQALAIRRRFAVESLDIAASLNYLGLVERRRNNLAKAEDFHHQALAIQEKLAPASLPVAKTLDWLGTVAYWRRDLPKAEDYYRQSLIIREKLAPGSLDVAISLDDLGNVASLQNDFTKAEEYYHQSLAIAEEVAPASLLTAGIFENLTFIARARGDFRGAEQYERKVVDIEEKSAPESTVLADSLKSLGILVDMRGDPTTADAYYLKALAIEQKLAPDGLGVADSLALLGDTAEDRGDLAKAEEYLRQALAIQEKLAPGGYQVARSLTILGLIAQDRSDLIKAEQYQRRSLAIREKLNWEVARGLKYLGDVERQRGDSTKAESHYRQALALNEKVPDDFEIAGNLNDLGEVARQRGDLDKAEELQLRALGIQQKIVPGSLLEAVSLDHLGRVALDRRDLPKAETYYRQELAIHEKIIPGSTSHAETMAALAGIMHKREQVDAAAQLYERALDTMESLTARIGGGREARLGFRARHANYYRDYIDLLVQQGKQELAFHMLERSRARTLLETLADAHADIRTSSDPSLMEREKSVRQLLNAKSSHRFQLLSEKHSAEQLAAIDQDVGELLAQYQEIEEQIRTRNPNYAALVQPHAMTVEEVQRQLLGPDTILLEYELGEDRSYVFVLGTGHLAVFNLPKRAEIELVARRLYDVLTAPNRAKTELQRQAEWKKAQKEFPGTAAELGRMILGPIAGELKDKRLLIVSDGALEYVPFALLPSLEQEDRPLIVEHEIINLPSASVLALLRQGEAGRRPPARAVAVLADPVFDKSDVRVGANGRVAGFVPKPDSRDESSLDLLTRSLADVNGGLGLPRLRFSRLEAEEILKVTPAGKGKKALDFEASRETAISPELAKYRIVHFATHGLLDSEHPELSGLVLSLVDKRGRPKNGFLDLQDIYNLSLPVELVVLSACETGLGKQVNGEGLVGLTRGFMYAGANRVVASLWNVSDVATAQLMGQFYKDMEQEGMRPAAALRAAQIAMWKQKRWSSPYYWAAFQIQGEWK